jgi:hypothetical protein
MILQGYWQAVVVAAALLVFVLAVLANLVQWRSNLHVRPAGTFLVLRSAAIERAESAGCRPGVRAQLRWRKPVSGSYMWMLANVCLATDELIIIPDLAFALLLASSYPPRLTSYVVPRRRITGASWISNPVRPSRRWTGMGGRIIAIVTDANCACFMGSRRPEELDVLLSAPRITGRAEES